MKHREKYEEKEIVRTKKELLWNCKWLKTRVKSEKVGMLEMIFGYFVGPLGVLVMTTLVSTYYLTYYRTYKDIVLLRGFLTLLPLLSVIPMVLSNIIVGIFIGKTKTSQGKARPYILAAAPFLLASGILIFSIPNLNLGFRMLWIVITYNLFASVANPLYATSHYLMVSVSTRDLKQRGTLSVISNIPAVAANGFVSSILMPLVLSWIKSAENTQGVQNRWQMIMTVFSVIAFFCCILEYYFTRERITEEELSNNNPSGDSGEERKVSAVRQIRSAASDKYWWIIMLFYVFYQAGVMFKGGFIFNIFCNEFFSATEVFGTVLNGEMIQSVLAMISGIPLAAGMLFIWPLADKFGKRNMVEVGLFFSVIGSLVCVINPGDFRIVLIGQTLKGIGSIPGAYIMMALFADVLDHLEARFGFRCDGVSMSVYNSIITVVNGFAVAFFLFFYDNPSFSTSKTAEFFFVGYEIFAHTLLFIILWFLNVEKLIKEEQELIASRNKDCYSIDRDSEGFGES